MHTLLSVLLCSVLLASAADEASHELPERHRRHNDLRYSNTTVIAGDPELGLCAMFDGPGKRVELRWLVWSHRMMTQKIVSRFVETTYHPLAVCVEAPLADVCYVVGWDAETNETLVERWVVRALRPVVNGYNVIGEAEFEDLVWSHTAEEVVRWTGRLAYDAAFHPTARELLVLRDAHAEDVSREIVAIDVDGRAAPVSRFTSENVPSIDTAIWLSLAVGAEYGRVYVFVMPSMGDFFNPKHLHTHVLTDVDDDGHFEISFAAHVDAIARRFADVEMTETYQAAPRTR